MAQTKSTKSFEKIKSYIEAGVMTHILNIRISEHQAIHEDSVIQHLVRHLASENKKHVRGADHPISIEWTPVDVLSNRKFYSKNIFNDTAVRDHVSQVISDFCDVHKCRISWIVWSV